MGPAAVGRGVWFGYIGNPIFGVRLTNGTARENAASSVNGDEIGQTDVQRSALGKRPITERCEAHACASYAYGLRPCGPVPPPCGQTVLAQSPVPVESHVCRSNRAH